MLTICHAGVQYLKHETPYIGGMVANLCWLFTRYFFRGPVVKLKLIHIRILHVCKTVIALFKSIQQVYF